MRMCRFCGSFKEDPGPLMTYGLYGGVFEKNRTTLDVFRFIDVRGSKLESHKWINIPTLRTETVLKHAAGCTIESANTTMQGFGVSTSTAHGRTRCSVLE